MITIHTQSIGNKVLLPNDELKALIELARQKQEIKAERWDLRLLVRSEGTNDEDDL